MQEHLFDWQKKESCAVPHENENNIPRTTHTAFVPFYNILLWLTNGLKLPFVGLFFFFPFDSKNQHFQFFWGNSGKEKCPAVKPPGT